LSEPFPRREAPWRYCALTLRAIDHAKGNLL
jgi:hypothetical protein